MKKILALFVFLSMFFTVSAALALDFSADMVSKAKGKEFSGKIYVTQDKVRTEMAGAVNIMRMDKKIMWVLMPGEKMYMEQPVDPQMAAGAAEKIPGEIERTLLGSEAIEGRPANKYKITYKNGAIIESILQWSDAATSLPVKVTSEDGSWSMEYKNLKLGAPDQSLFEIPEGYQKFSMPSFGDMTKQFKK